MHSHNLFQWEKKSSKHRNPFSSKNSQIKQQPGFRGMCLIHIHVFVESSVQVFQLCTEMDSNFMVLS